MNLAQMLGIDLTKIQVILIGSGELTNTMSATGEPYYLFKLKSPVMVGCSMDADIERFEADEVYLRQSALTDESLTIKLVTPDKPEDGFYFDKWVIDFSLGQRIPIYQETTIREWSKGNRGVRRVQRTIDANTSIRAKLEARKAAGQ